MGNKARILFLEIILIIVLFFLFMPIGPSLEVISRKIKEDRKEMTKSSIVVENYTGFELKYYTQLILEELYDVHDVRVIIVYMGYPIILDNGNQILAHIYPAKIPWDFYVIAISRYMKPYMTKQMILHELYHLKQMETSTAYMINDSLMVYNQTDTINLGEVPYDERYHEKEIYEMQDSLMMELEYALVKRRISDKKFFDFLID
jgi:hypothetical protein